MQLEIVVSVLAVWNVFEGYQNVYIARFMEVAGNRRAKYIHAFDVVLLTQSF